ncbi:MAG: hypothetical protein ACLP1Y_01775 [Candidatus Acidiferrales bacterium]
MASMDRDSFLRPTQQEIDEESRRIRRLRLAVELALSVIAAGQLPYQDAQDLASGLRQVALRLFPDKGEVFDLVYAPRIRRMINEVYRLQ